MTVAPARGNGCQTDIIPSPSRILSSPDDSTIFSPVTPTSTETTASHTLPLTPQRGRPTARYPDSLGRVPLHRRGTSKTYERLEDLLREAGYKETRVFTPDANRDARLAAKKQDGGTGNSVRESVGAVVDFIAGFINRGSGLSRETALAEDNSGQSALHAWSSPPSPLAHTAHIEDNRTIRVSSMTSLSHSGPSGSTHRRTYVDLSADASQRTYQVAQLHHSSQGPTRHPHSYLMAHHHHRINHPHQLDNYSSESSSTKPNPPNARTYLRHMISAPNIQPLAKQPPLSETSLRSHAFRHDHRNGTRRTLVLNDGDGVAESANEPHPRVTIDDHEHRAHPPLPRNWLESVAKALLSGVSGPTTVASDAASTRTAKTASTRKSSALSDKSNQERGRNPTWGTKPPLLCVQVQDVKARTSEGQVSCTRVMCRSTPTSRASSRVGHVTRGDHTKARMIGEGDRLRSHRRVKDRDADVVPSLARTKAENDNWMAPRQRYSNGWGMKGGTRAYPGGVSSDDSDGDEDDEDDEEDEEEGELGLARLLVPARRQHSIQSLRKHLQRPPSQLFGGRAVSRPRSPRSDRASPFGGVSTGRLDWGNASWSTSRGREWLTSEGEVAEDGYSYVFSGSEVGAGKSNAKHRRGLPGLAQWTTSP